MTANMKEVQESLSSLTKLNGGGMYALGIGHWTPVMIDLAISCGYDIAGLYHYKEGRTGETDHGYKVLGSFDDLFKEDLQGRKFLLTMGDNDIRTELADKIIAKGGEVPSLIHPNTDISRFADISPVGVYISAFSEIQADTVVECCTYILSQVCICHNCKIGRGSFIAAKVLIGAHTEIGEKAFIGQGALSISGKVKTIGTKAYIGARSLLTKDVPPRALMVGSPARKVREI